MDFFLSNGFPQTRDHHLRVKGCPNCPINTAIMLKMVVKCFMHLFYFCIQNKKSTSSVSSSHTWCWGLLIPSASNTVLSCLVRELSVNCSCHLPWNSTLLMEILWSYSHCRARALLINTRAFPWCFSELLLLFVAKQFIDCSFSHH